MDKDSIDLLQERLEQWLRANPRLQKPFVSIGYFVGLFFILLNVIVYAVTMFWDDAETFTVKTCEVLFRNKSMFGDN